MSTHPIDLVSRVKARMAELGLTQADVVRRGRFNAAFVSDLLRGKKLTLREANYARLATALLTTEHFLKTGVAPSDSELERIKQTVGWVGAPRNQEGGISDAQLNSEDEKILGRLAPDGTIADAPSLEAPARTDNLQVYRSGGRWDGGAVIEALPFDRLAALKPSIVARLYALAISDSTMAPRYEPGELVYVVGGAEDCRPRDYVALTVRGRVGRREVEIAYVRQLLARTDKEIVVRQLTPSVETRWNAADVVRMERIILAGEPMDIDPVVIAD